MICLCIRVCSRIVEVTLVPWYPKNEVCASLKVVVLEVVELLCYVCFSFHRGDLVNISMHLECLWHFLSLKDHVLTVLIFQFFVYIGW